LSQLFIEVVTHSRLVLKTKAKIITLDNYSMHIILSAAFHNCWIKE